MKQYDLKIFIHQSHSTELKELLKNPKFAKYSGQIRTELKNRETRNKNLS